MKAIILSAGRGKRLNPITSTRPKPLIPVGGKPLLEHTIMGLKNAGIDTILLIVGYKQDKIKNYFGNGDKFGIKIEYITQDDNLGTAHATSYAKNFISDNSPFLLMYGDIIVDQKIFREIISNFNKNKAKGLISLIEVEDPHQFGIISLNSEGIVEEIVEKPSPEQNLGNLANAGIYIFDPLIFKAIKMTKKSSRNEFELTDSMDILINKLNGEIIGHIIKNQFWSDIGLPWQLLDANHFLLDNIESSILGVVEDNVKISGNVYIGKNTLIRSGTSIQGPCFIGNNNSIGPNAYIRPYTFIDENCHVGMSEIKNSIIFSNTAIPHFNYVGDSIICENVNLAAGSKISNLRLDDDDIKVMINGILINSKRRKFGSIVGPNVKTGINISIMCGKIIGENSWIGPNTLVNENIPPNTIYYQDPNRGIIKKSK
ncbi:MAG: bifunctional sugar-1-phosphate nucleotidylyltransferase/acetyltransferase [Promethearchaeota archaeon]